MCGAYPLFAGICTPAQEKRLVGHMMSEKHLWTRIGMTSVDRSAPYYTPDGYWNGAVWMPHQWFVWKSLLDLGHGEEAWRIASAGLDVWSGEVNTSYLCLEHFMVESGRAGRVAAHDRGYRTRCWRGFNAYYLPGRLTAGYETWIERAPVSGQQSAVAGRPAAVRRGGAADAGAGRDAAGWDGTA